MMNKTSYVTSVTMQFEENLLLHVSHGGKLWKNVYIEISYEQIFLTAKQDTRNGKITENQLFHMQELPLTTPAKNYMCVCCNRHMQKHVCKMYNKVKYDFTTFCCMTMLRTCIKFCT